MQNGKITDVQTLQLPGGQFRSQQIGQYAAPQLRSEVLAAQSAQVNTISGATYTSEGYLQSVQSALDQAGAERPDSPIADGLRTALARIWSAVLTQAKGVEPSFH